MFALKYSKKHAYFVQRKKIFGVRCTLTENLLTTRLHEKSWGFTQKNLTTEATGKKKQNKKKKQRKEKRIRRKKNPPHPSLAKILSKVRWESWVTNDFDSKHNMAATKCR